MKTSVSNEQKIMQSVSFEKEIGQIEEIQETVSYFKMVERAKEELKKTNPKIPEKDLDLYL